MKTFIRILIAVYSIIVSGWSIAQAYPSKPLRFIIGYPPGTILDGTVRIVMGEAEKILGQPIVIDFRPGANGTIGAKAVVNSPPDGYTFLYGNPIAIHPLFNKENSVNARTELAPVSDFTVTPFFLFSSAKIPAASFKELVAYGKENPGKVTYASTSQIIDLMMQILTNKTGLQSRSIPYRAPPQIIPDLLSGEIFLSVGTLQAYLPHLQQGTIRTLFVSSLKRDPLAPNVPTTEEIGIQDYIFQMNFGLWAPGKTSSEVTHKVSAAISTAIRMPRVGDQIRTAMTANPVGSTPEEQLRTFDSNIKFWADALRSINFQVQ